MLTQIRDAVREDSRTLSQIAELCGLDAGRLSRFVRGKRDLSLAAAARLCEALGFTLVHTASRPAAEPPATEKSKRGRKPKPEPDAEEAPEAAPPKRGRGKARGE
jgi:transcriptional regulator with XRE-family HTH domain